MRTVGNSIGRAALVLLLLSGPALVTLKVSNSIELETDLTFVRQ